MLCELMCEALSSRPVIGLCREDTVHSTVYLQDGDAERRASEFVHQDMTVFEKRKENEASEELKETAQLGRRTNSVPFSQR